MYQTIQFLYSRVRLVYCKSLELNILCVPEILHTRFQITLTSELETDFA